MNKKQYNNIIKNTLKRVHTEDSLSAARAVFKNMGVALPGGDIKEVFETVKTDNYMGWKSCTMEEAQAAANNGTAAIGISDSKIVVLAANDAEEPIEPTAEVLAITDSTPAVAVAGLQYYSYGYGGTTCVSNLYFANSSLNVKVGWKGYNTLYGSTSSTVHWYSSNTNVVTVDASGYLQAVGTGQAWVTATTNNGCSADFYVKVESLSKYVSVQKTIIRDVLFSSSGVPSATVQSYPVLLNLFYTITKVNGNSVFVESVSAFTKYDKSSIIFGVTKPDISVASIAIDGKALSLSKNEDVLLSPEWVYDAKISNVNKWVNKGTKLSAKTILMCNSTIQPYADVDAETQLNI